MHRLRRVLIISCLACLPLPILASAQAENTYGKTESQILAMGPDRWSAFYESKTSDSTADMAKGAQIFGDIARRRNDGLVKTASPTLRNRVLKLRTLMNDYAGAAIDLGYNFDGGGTIWVPISAGIETDIERVLHAILGGTEKKANDIMVSAVNSQLNELEGVIVKTHADSTAAGYFKYGDAKKSLATMRVDWRRILSIAKGLDRADSDRVLGFCKDYAKTAKGDFS